MKKLENLYKDSDIILIEGAFVERLKDEYNLKLNDFINHAGLIYSNSDILEKMYKEYIDIAQKFDLPIMIMTPTRKVNIESKQKTVYREKNILKDSCNFLNNI